MTTKENLEEMCMTYEKWVGMGNMKMAGRLLPAMIRALVTYVEEKSDDFDPNLPEGILEEFGLFFNKEELNEEVKPPFIASDGTTLSDSFELLSDYEATLAENVAEFTPNVIVEIDDNGHKTFSVDVGDLDKDAANLFIEKVKTTYSNPPPCEPCDMSKGAEPFDSVFTDDPEDMIVRTPSYLLTAAQAPTISGKVFRAQTAAWPPPQPLSVNATEGKIVNATTTPITEAVKPKAPTKPKKPSPARKPVKSSPATKPKAPVKPK